MTSFNLRIHLFNLGLGEVFRVELEVLVTSWRTVLLGPFNIHPEDINRESISSEVSVSLHEHVSTYICPLAEMET